MPIVNITWTAGTGHAFTTYGTGTDTGTFYYRPVPIPSKKKKKKVNLYDQAFQSDRSFLSYEETLERYRGYSFYYRSKYHSTFKGKKLAATIVGLAKRDGKVCILIHFRSKKHITSMRIDDYGELTYDLGIRNVYQKGNYWLCSFNELECNGCKNPNG